MAEQERTRPAPLAPLPDRNREDYWNLLANWHMTHAGGVALVDRGGDPALTDAGELQVVPHPDYDPFAGYEPLPGMEHLGRHIRDRFGKPSGSPANFEQTRGAPHPDGWAAVADETVADAEAILAELRSQFPPKPE